MSSTDSNNNGKVQNGGGIVDSDNNTETTQLLVDKNGNFNSITGTDAGSTSFHNTTSASHTTTSDNSSSSSYAQYAFYNNYGASERSISRQHWNIGLSIGLCIVCIAFVVFGYHIYDIDYRIPHIKALAIAKAIRDANAIAAAREVQCADISWETACDRMTGSAGARRQLQVQQQHQQQQDQLLRILDENDTQPPSTTGNSKVFPGYVEAEDALLLDQDDVRVMYDTNCLRIYRIEMFREKITFPYHGSQLLTLGGNHTMALFIQHGALRNAPNYFCSFKTLMKQQMYRNYQDILIIAPDFNYGADPLVHPKDAFWNKSKPWGDWRVGADSDPKCCGNTGRTVSSFDVLDHMLALLTDQKLYPYLNKISFVGHSAGGQMIQRYAVLSILAALWDYEVSVQVRFIVANPSSYTYMTPQRYTYNCGNCTCNENECHCDASCTTMSNTLVTPTSRSVLHHDHPCYIWNYDRWPYGIGSLNDAKNGHSIPYAERNGVIGTARSVRMYKNLHMIYLVGQNDTCNDNLPTCDNDCWKRGDNYDADAGEWSCFRNDMDTRCPAMLQGPNRRTRGYYYMKYLEWLYGEPTHKLYTIAGVGHNATGIFSSDVGMRELFE